MTNNQPSVYLCATGIALPPDKISNDELVAAFNQYVDSYNAANKAAIDSGEKTALAYSTSEFIEKASGIKSRYVIDKKGILDPDIMSPIVGKKPLGESLSVMAELGTRALEQALHQAGLTANDLDGVICASSNFQRVYPAIAIEIQAAIGMTRGFGYDMNVACSAATFGIAQAAAMIKGGMARRIAVVNVEIPSAHLNFRNRDSHFIFGDAAAASIISADIDASNQGAYEILDSALLTQFSANIKNEYGFMDRSEALAAGKPIHHDLTEPVTDKLFSQEGRKVFREVCPMVSQFISDQLDKNNIDKDSVAKLWLHQANINMIDLILRTVLGKEANKARAPIVISEYGNTSSASPIVAFHDTQEGVKSGDLGIICSFGAGYSVGSLLLKKV